MRIKRGRQWRDLGPAAPHASDGNRASLGIALLRLTDKLLSDVPSDKLERTIAGKKR